MGKFIEFFRSIKKIFFRNQKKQIIYRGFVLCNVSPRRAGEGITYEKYKELEWKCGAIDVTAYTVTTTAHKAITEQ